MRRTQSLLKMVAEKKEELLVVAKETIAGVSDGVVNIEDGRYTMVGNRRVNPEDVVLTIGGVAIVGTEENKYTDFSQRKEEEEGKEYSELLISSGEDESSRTWWLVNSDGVFYLDIASLIPLDIEGITPPQKYAVKLRYGETMDRIIASTVVYWRRGDTAPFRKFYVLKINRSEDATEVPTVPGVFAPVGMEIPVVDMTLEEEIDIFNLPPIALNTTISYDLTTKMYYPTHQGTRTDHAVWLGAPFDMYIEEGEATIDGQQWHFDEYPITGSFDLVFAKEHIDPNLKTEETRFALSGLAFSAKRWDDYFISLVDFTHRRTDDKNDILLLVRFHFTGPAQQYAGRPRKEARISGESVEIYLPLQGQWGTLELNSPGVSRLNLGGGEYAFFTSARPAIYPIIYSGESYMGSVSDEENSHVAVISTFDQSVVWKDAEDVAYNNRAIGVYTNWHEWEVTYNRIADPSPDLPDGSSSTIAANNYGHFPPLYVVVPGGGIWITGAWAEGFGFFTPGIGDVQWESSYIDYGYVETSPEPPLPTNIYLSRHSMWGWRSVLRGNAHGSPLYGHQRFEPGGISIRESTIYIAYAVQLERGHSGSTSRRNATHVRAAIVGSSSARSPLEIFVFPLSGPVDYTNYALYRSGMATPDLGFFVGVGIDNDQFFDVIKGYMTADFQALSAGQVDDVFIFISPPFPEFDEAIVPLIGEHHSIVPVWNSDAAASLLLIFRQRSGSFLSYSLSTTDATITEEALEFATADVGTSLVIDPGLNYEEVAISRLAIGECHARKITT